MNQTEQITPEQLEQMMGIYELMIFPTWIHLFIFFAIIFFVVTLFYIIARAIHYKLECKRLRRRIKELEDEFYA